MNSYIFIGRSGCGKGTQAELLKKYIEGKGDTVLYIETGDKFRSFIKEDTFSSLRSKEIYEKADRQPDFLACLMWTEAMINTFTGKESVIFDGTPRSLPETMVLETALLFYKFEKRFLIYLDVSRQWSEARLTSRGRSDDVSLLKIDKRLNWFESDVLPAIEHFKSSPLYHFGFINGERDIETVHKSVLDFVEPLL